MAMICVICKLSGTVDDAMLLPHTVVYRGYSLCEEHLQMWASKGNSELDWAEINVVKVDLSDTDTVEEKVEKLEEAAAEFDADRPGFEDPDTCLLPTEDTKPNSDNSTEELLELAKPKGLARKRKKKGKKKKGKKGGKKK